MTLNKRLLKNVYNGNGDIDLTLGTYLLREAF